MDWARARKKGTGSRPRTVLGISGKAPAGRVPVPFFRASTHASGALTTLGSGGRSRSRSSGRSSETGERHLCRLSRRGSRLRPAGERDRLLRPRRGIPRPVPGRPVRGDAGRQVSRLDSGGEARWCRAVGRVARRSEWRVPNRCERAEALVSIGLRPSLLDAIVILEAQPGPLLSHPNADGDAVHRCLLEPGDRLAGSSDVAEPSRRPLVGPVPGVHSTRPPARPVRSTEVSSDQRARVPSAAPVPPERGRGAASFRLLDSTRASGRRAAWTSTERSLDRFHVLRLMTGTMSPAGSGRTAPGSMIARRSKRGKSVRRPPASLTTVDIHYVPLLLFTMSPYCSSPLFALFGEDEVHGCNPRGTTPSGTESESLALSIQTVGKRQACRRGVNPSGLKPVLSA